MSLLEELRQRRTAARTAADAVLTRAAEDPAGPRDLTPEELAEYTSAVAPAARSRRRHRARA